MQDQKTIGSIACYTNATHCAITTLGGEDGTQFEGPLETREFPVGKPTDAFAAAAEFFDGRPLAALGTSMYGIVDAEKQMFLGSTQDGWTDHFDIAELCLKHLGASISSQKQIICCNDSASAAVTEYLWGSARDLSQDHDPGRVDAVYFKILDGIGSGIIQDGRLWHGFAQPEMGHIPVRRYMGAIGTPDARPDNLSGTCPFHHDCIEGLASHAALNERLLDRGDITSIDALLNNKNDELWDLQAYYLGELAAIASIIVTPRRIVLAGPMIHKGLVNKVLASFKSHIASYPENLANKPDNFIRRAAFEGSWATLVGALDLARGLATRSEQATDYILRENSVVQQSPFAEAIDKATNDNAEPEASVSAKSSEKVRLPTQPVSSKRKIFGLSINETIQWGVAEAINGHFLGETIEDGLFSEIPASAVPFDGSDPIQIQDLLISALKGLKARKRNLLADIQGVGVSTIGVVDRKGRALESVARKNWAPEKGAKHLIDFEKLFIKSGVFPYLKIDQITVQNDAPARCLTEYYGSNGKLKNGSGRVRSLVYLAVGEGVNGAVVHDGQLPHMLAHPEMGHQLPLAHPQDVFAENGIDHFDQFLHTGCPKHLRCFEGVASQARIRNQWGKELWQLPPQHIAWDIEAWYLAQFAMNAVLTHDSDRVVFGGQIFNPPKENCTPIERLVAAALIDRVREQFVIQNAGYIPKYATLEYVEPLIQSASFGEEIKLNSALVTACVGAFSSDMGIWSRSVAQSANALDTVVIHLNSVRV